MNLAQGGGGGGGTTDPITSTDRRRDPACKLSGMSSVLL